MKSKRPQQVELPAEGWVTAENEVVAVGKGSRHGNVAQKLLWKRGMRELVTRSRRYSSGPRVTGPIGVNMELLLDASYELGWVRYEHFPGDSPVGISHLGVSQLWFTMGARNPARIATICTSVLRAFKAEDVYVNDWGDSDWRWERGMSILFGEPMPIHCQWKEPKGKVLNLLGDAGKWAHIHLGRLGRPNRATREEAILDALLAGYVLYDLHGGVVYGKWLPEQVLPAVPLYYRLESHGGGYRWVLPSPPQNFESRWYGKASP